MVVSVRAAARAAAVASLLGLAAPLLAQDLPDHFVSEDVASFTLPTCIRFATPDDLFVAEKGGRVFLVHAGVKQATPVIDLSLEVLNNGDRGLMSVAPDPDWVNNGLIYLLYTVDPNGDGVDTEQETFNRLTRYATMTDTSGNVVADPASRTILIGATWPEGIPSLHFSHAAGDLRFASDGSLYVSTGDGAHYDLTDWGGNDPNGFGPGKFDASEDIGAYRAQSLTSLCGKILRIDPATGLGLPDNPFFTGNAADHQSLIWAMGLRNPFRICLMPGSATPEELYVCDVGWETWEEIDHCVGGENFGWPCFEAAVDNTAYESNDPLGKCSDPSLFTAPLWYYNHDHYEQDSNPDFVGQCTAGCLIYNGIDYPSSYVGRLFVADYASEWLRTLVLVNGSFAQSDRFESNDGHGVDLEADPRNGDILYAALSANAVRRVRYTLSNQPPVALATLAPTFGPAPLTVSFDATASYDPEGSALTYDWDLGDGNHSSQPTLSYAYAIAGVYDVALTVTDPGGLTATLHQLISVDNSPPAIDALNAPAPGSSFRFGQPITFDASVSDAEDDAAALPLDVKWVVDLVEDEVHPGWATLTGPVATFTPAGGDEEDYLHVTLVVTDSGGLTATQEFDLYNADAEPIPQLVAVSNPSPRVGHEITATGRLLYAGHGAAKLTFDWGDGQSETFHPTHLVERHPRHTYVGPGSYTLRLTASDRSATHDATQAIDVRPRRPAVAIFVPLVQEHWLPLADQWTIASQLVADVQAAGFDARTFDADQEGDLQAWLEDFLPDRGVRDYLVCLDAAPSVAYAGQNHGSLAERWLAAGKGIAWTGYHPFSWYVTPDGDESQQGAGDDALDEILNAALPQLASGVATMDLAADAADLPALTTFDTSCGVVTANLSTDWSIARLYESDGNVPPISDALVVRNAKGGEYAQFFCADDLTLPREAVLRDFFSTHVFVGLPDGPQAFTLVSPPARATDVAAQPTLTWNASPGATSWRVELAENRSFRKVLFTTIVLRGATLARTASATVTTKLTPGASYVWRVTAQNDFGTLVAGPHEFRVADPGPHATPHD